MHPDKYRWLVAGASIAIEICVGTMYIWSVFKGPLIDLFQWDPVRLSMAFSIMLACFLGLPVVWGRVQDVIGPRWVTTLGGILYFLGLFLASKTTSLTYMYLTYGILGGAGAAACYICPLSACLKWFPDKRGLLSGLIMAGYGMGSMVFSGIAAMLIIRYGILDSFAVLGAIFGVTIIVCAQVLRNPPENYTPEGWTPPAASADGEKTGERKNTGAEFAWYQMLRTPVFWLMVASYFFSANVGMMTVTNLVGIATNHGMAMTAAVMAVSLYSFFNAGGRIVFGIASDRWGRLPMLRIIFALEIVSLLSLFVLSGTIVLVPLCCIGLAWGGVASVYPALTADFFGSRNVAMNFGFALGFLGVGLISSPMIYDFLKRPGSPIDPLIFCAAMVAVGMGILFILRPPAPPK